jgi:hypothetical protein
VFPTSHEPGLTHVMVGGRTGKRCEMEGCRKPASERTNNLCADHFAWSQRDAYDASPPPLLAAP